MHTQPDGPEPLAGRTALVTGATRGLGRHIAEALAFAGADLVVASRSQASCDAVAEEITKATGRRVIGHQCHVGTWADVDQLVEHAYARMGAIDILVNNAGIAPLYRSLADVTEDLFDKVMAVNLKGPFRLCALVGGRMAAGHGGSIINVSSVAAVQPIPSALPYGASKAALQALTVGFAQALGPTVRVNTIMAGPILTDMSKHWDLGKVAEQVSRFPLRRSGLPEELVGAAVFLASDASSYTTGSTLSVDGGMSVAYFDSGFEHVADRLPS